ncbi:MAG: family 16 glycosylhydrolase [Bacteroidota bacterium]
MKNLGKTVLALAFLFTTGTAVLAQCYELVWSDEFNGTGFPDSEYWTGETGAGGWGNGELQYYKNDDPDNLWMSDGTLKITAIKESYSGSEYTSARIITRGKYSFSYGKIEGRLKLPYGQGIWPAFWMMGESISSVGWPACSETDIMEMIGGSGRDNTVYGTGHWDNNGSHASYGGNYTLSSGIFADDFHTFSVEWTPKLISWYVDGNKFVSLDITPSGLSEFHGDNFILLNLAVGGTWPGYPNSSTVFPQTLEVDYIRVYQLDTTPPVFGDTAIAMNEQGLKYSLPEVEGWTYDWSVPEGAQITAGQGTPEITVDWGCDEGDVICHLTTACASYDISRHVAFDFSIDGPMFVDANGENVLFTTPEMPGTAYTWTFPEGVTVSSGDGTDSVYVNWGTVFGDVQLTMQNSCGTRDTSFTVVKSGQYPYPDIYSPHHIPGTIPATEYDYGGEGVAYHDLTAVNEGNGVRQDERVDTEFGDNGNPNVGWISSGEWLEYTVKVDSAAWYKAVLRLATANGSGGPFYINFNDQQVFGPITVSNTGGWTKFTTVSSNSAWLTEDDTLMRVAFNTGGFNLSTISFVPGTPVSAESFTGMAGLSVYPNPFTDRIQLNCEETLMTVEILDITGKQVFTMPSADSQVLSLDLSGLDSGIYLLKATGQSGATAVQRIIKIR